MILFLSALSTHSLALFSRLIIAIMEFQIPLVWKRRMWPRNDLVTKKNKTKKTQQKTHDNKETKNRFTHFSVCQRNMCILLSLQTKYNISMCTMKMSRNQANTPIIDCSLISKFLNTRVVVNWVRTVAGWWCVVASLDTRIGTGADPEYELENCLGLMDLERKQTAWLSKFMLIVCTLTYAYR